MRLHELRPYNRLSSPRAVAFSFELQRFHPIKCAQCSEACLYYSILTILAHVACDENVACKLGSPIGASLTCQTSFPSAERDRLRSAGKPTKRNCAAAVLVCLGPSLESGLTPPNDAARESVTRR